MFQTVGVASEIHRVDVVLKMRSLMPFGCSTNSVRQNSKNIDPIAALKVVRPGQLSFRAELFI